MIYDGQPWVEVTITQRVDPKAPAYVVGIRDSKWANRLGWALVEQKVEVVESFFGELSPALAVHTGPGMTGLCYYPVDE